MIESLTRSDNAQFTKLFAFQDSKTGLILAPSLPSEVRSDVFYFLKDKKAFQSVGEVTPENIANLVYFGSCRQAPLDGLLHLLKGVFAGDFRANKSWPETVRKEFTSQVSRFLANLTETVHSAKGSTVLYIPEEDLSDLEASAKMKDLVQRLESTVIHWTRQIKAVVNAQEASEQAEDANPLAEIQFWKSRSVDLSGIQEQLIQPGVQRIVEVLELAKSSYLSPFQSLSNSIQRGSDEAQDNLRFLKPIEIPCQKLAAALPSDIPAMLPNILNYVRVIWSLSKHYNSAERISGLLRKISNQIIDRCCSILSVQEITDGAVEASVKKLNESIHCGEEWKRCYRRCVRLIDRSEKDRKWDFDESRIFAQIDAFVQRCRDLMEISEWRMQFTYIVLVPGTDERVSAIPSFGGSRGVDIQKSLEDIRV